MSGDPLRPSPSDESINPNHPVTRAMDTEWHKLAAIAVFQAGGRIEITTADIEAFHRSRNRILAVKSGRTAIVLELLDDAAAAELAARFGGRPA